MEAERVLYKVGLWGEMEARVANIEDRARAEAGSQTSREEVEATIREVVGWAVDDAVHDTVRRERERLDAEMTWMQRGAREVLDWERRAMSERMCRTIKQVCKWVIRQQQDEQLLKQVMVLQEEAERFGGGCPYCSSCLGLSSPPNWY